MNLIDRDRLIKDIDFHVMRCEKIFEGSSPTCFAHCTYSTEDIFELVKKQPIVNQWIKCSERPPKVAERCLLMLENETVLIGIFHSNNKYTFECTGINYVYQKKSVIAWQPLPPKYEGQKWGANV